VAGGLGEYLGVDATVLRVGFVIASLLFLGGLGGPVLYVIAWLVVPEEGKDSAVTKATFSGRPWQDWDRSARSWALVLGALALALIWSFGIWPWWHWRVLPFWLVGLAVVLWLLARHRDGSWVSSPPAAPPVWGSSPGQGPVPGTGPVAGPGPANGGGPAAPAPDAGPPAYGPYVPDAPGPETSSTSVAASVATMTTPISSGPFTAAGPTNPEPPAQPTGEVGGTVANGAPGNGSTATTVGPGRSQAPMPNPVPVAVPARVGGLGTAGPSGSTDPKDPTEADWAAAQSAAADWAAGQLALAGVPVASNNGKSNGAPATTNRSGQSYAARSLRRAVRVLVALMAALVLLAVLTVVGVTLGTGSSLRGGVGDNSYSPANLSAVQSYYRLGAGNLDLNLAAVKFPPAGKTVDVTVGLGNLTVEVPKGTVVSVDAKTGIGQVDVFGQRASNVQTTYYSGTGTASGAPRLNLDAHVGMGDLQVTQG
jgi:phage shock protein PspC (stress-responsive transcriptional regulator)